MINVEEKNAEEQKQVNLEINTKKENNEKTENIIITDKNNKKSKVWIIVSVIIILLIILMLILSTIFAIINSRTNKIVKGIYIENVDVSNITEEEAKSILTELSDKTKQNEILFKYKEIETPITYEALEVNFDIDSAIKEAYSLGRSGNIFQNNFEILKTWINGKKIKLNFNIDEDVIQQVCENINNTSVDAVVEPSYYVENEKLIITSGKKGIKVKEDELLGKIIEIRHSNELVSVYQSLSEVNVKENDKVLANQVIGKSGTNELDKDMGNHLHFELYVNGQVVDPTLYLNKEVQTSENKE